MATTNLGPVKWSFIRDSEGHRTYKITFRVQNDDGDGPATVLDTAGLPLEGETWDFFNDKDEWAYCRADTQISAQYEGEVVRFHLVEFTFSTKPQDPDKQRCQDNPIENPLLEPYKVNGSFKTFQEEATYDRFNVPILNSAHEQIRGPQVEFDKGRPTVTIEQNVASLDLAVVAAMMHTVNDAPMWGLDRRCWKLSDFTWERKFYGTCFVYYTRKLTFDASVNTFGLSAFDKDLLDEGTKVINGHWSPSLAWIVDLVNGSPPDPDNPNHFIKAKDARGENIRVVLNGRGQPAKVSTVGVPILLVASTVLTNNSNPVIAAQPAAAAKLKVSITDADNSISQGVITLQGKNEDGVSITEKLDISDAGTVAYPTDNYYTSLDQVLVGSPNVLSGDALVGNDALDTIKVETDESTFEPGNIHVEKYAESNFFLLNVPVDF